MTQSSNPKKNPNAIPTVSRVLDDGSLIELVLNEQSNATALAIFRDGVANVAFSLVLQSGEELTPIPAKNNLIKHRVVLLSETASDFGSVDELVSEIRAYISRYVDLSPEFLGIATYYVLLTWVYDAFNELPYLRVRGDFGCGKTRALLILGSICYKPFFASGASTVSPIFHTIDSFRGTLIFDEADFRFSDEKAELVKIFNNGNVRGFPVLRTTMTVKREFDPVAFLVYGPKVVGMRDVFQDPALESRFITEEMGQRPVRKDIPINLPDCQKDEALALRNQLLMYRFRMHSVTGIDPRLASPTLSHRLNQILVPLLSIIPDAGVQDDILRAAQALERNLTMQRAANPEAHLLEVLADGIADASSDKLSLADVTHHFIRRFGTEYERPITNRYLGALLQRRLRIFAYKSHGVFVIPKSEYEKIRVLCKRYGIEVPELSVSDPSGGCGDVGTLPADQTM